MDLSHHTSLPTPDAENAVYTIIPPPPCFTVIETMILTSTGSSLDTFGDIKKKRFVFRQCVQTDHRDHLTVWLVNSFTVLYTHTHLHIVSVFCVYMHRSNLKLIFKQGLIQMKTASSI